MSIPAGFIVPHPPLIVPEVGCGREKEIQKTIDSYRAVSGEIAALSPETVVLISPHAAMYADYIHISPGLSAKGSLRQFGAEKEYAVEYDAEFVEALAHACKQGGFPAGTQGEKDRGLDHGTLIPLHFIEARYRGFKLVRTGISGLSRQEHYEFGMLLGKTAEALGRRAVVVASGDLSHKLKKDGPYGLSPDGPKLDAALVEIMKSGDFGALFGLDEGMCENAAECGLRGFAVMAGALDKKAVAPRFLSYEGPFGVGYAVASFAVTGDDPARGFLSAVRERAALKMDAVRAGEDLYIRLARETLERYVNTGKKPGVPGGLPEEMVKRRAGVFVSLKKRGELRGCIGTISPVCGSIAEEIINNTVSSGTGDPRFSPVRPEELPELEYSVDVLSPAEPVPDKSALDAKRYGVIVSKGMRRGLLLPNLDGVDTVDEQLRIACRKAGISPHEGYAIERFEVVRHA